MWGRLDDHDSGDSDYYKSQQHHRPDSDAHHNVPETHEAYPSAQSSNIHQEERKKHWYDLDDHRKKELEVSRPFLHRPCKGLISMQVGGGLLAGAALLAGGYAAFKGHEKDEEEVRDSYSPHRRSLTGI